MMLTWLSKNEQRHAIPALVKVLESQHPAGRAQALSALADLEALSVTAMRVGLDDSHPGVRRNALRVGAHLFNIDAALGQRAATLLNDDDAHVQRQAAYALGSWKDPRAGQALARFLVKNADRPYLRAAALTSAGAFPDEVLLAVLGMGRTPVTTAISTELMGMLGEDAKKFVPRVLGRIAAKPAGGQSYEAWKLIAATRLLEAVGEDNSVRAQVGPMLAGARAIVDNEKEELARRIAAVQLIERAAASCPANSAGRYRATGASRSRRPSSTSSIAAAPVSGLLLPYCARSAMRPGISCWASSISLRPNATVSAERSATLYG